MNRSKLIAIDSQLNITQRGEDGSWDFKKSSYEEIKSLKDKVIITSLQDVILDEGLVPNKNIDQYLRKKYSLENPLYSRFGENLLCTTKESLKRHLDKWQGHFDPQIVCSDAVSLYRYAIHYMDMEPKNALIIHFQEQLLIVKIVDGKLDSKYDIPQYSDDFESATTILAELIKPIKDIPEHIFLAGSLEDHIESFKKIFGASHTYGCLENHQIALSIGMVLDQESEEAIQFRKGSMVHSLEKKSLCRKYIRHGAVSLFLSLILIIYSILPSETASLDEGIREQYQKHFGKYIEDTDQILDNWERKLLLQKSLLLKKSTKVPAVIMWLKEAEILEDLRIEEISYQWKNGNWHIELTSDQYLEKIPPFIDEESLEQNGHKISFCIGDEYK